MGLAEVYEVDLRIAGICSEMQYVGIGYNKARADEFAAILRDKERAAGERLDDVCGRKLKRTPGGGISTKDMHLAFFGEMRAPVFTITSTTGKAGLGSLALQTYATCGNEKLKAFALAELDRRKARKIRSTYIDSPKVMAAYADNRVHPSWFNYGTTSGRWTCQAPNLCQLPRASSDPFLAEYGGIRSLYEPAPGHVFVYYDKSQIEFRIAAYGSGDENMIAVCEGGDVHTNNAALLFPGMFDAAEYNLLKKKGKAGQLTAQEAARFEALDNLRTCAKSAVFAVCYSAEAPTVHQAIASKGIPVKLRTVEAMLNTMRKACRTYYKWQEDRLMACVRRGWTDSPILGRRRYLGHAPSPPECANHPIQAGASDVMNTEIPRVLAATRAHNANVRIVAHVYDSVLLEVPENDGDAIKAICRDESLKPIVIASSGAPRSAVLPIDIDILQRWK